MFLILEMDSGSRRAICIQNYVLRKRDRCLRRYHHQDVDKTIATHEHVKREARTSMRSRHISRVTGVPTLVQEGNKTELALKIEKYLRCMLTGE